MADQVTIELINQSDDINVMVDSHDELVSVDIGEVVNESVDISISEVGQQGNVGQDGGSGIEFYVLNEVPSGLIDGSNATFNTLNTFVSVIVRLNGLAQSLVNDYVTVSNNQIVFNVSPEVGDTITVDYIKQ
jgi:hypothetical protein